MKIKEMIDIIGIKGIPFIPQQAGMRKKGQLSIYANDNGINFFQHETIWGISIDDNCKEQVEKLRNSLKAR